VGRDLWRPTGPVLLLKPGHLQPAAQDHVQAASEYVCGWRPHHLSGQPVPVLSHPHSERVYPDIQREPPACQFVPMASGLSLDITKESLAPCSLHPPFRYLCTQMRLPKSSLLQAEQPQLSTFPHRRDAIVPSLSRPFAGLPQYIHVSHALRSPTLQE